MKFSLRLAVVALALFLAGCGSDSDDASGLEATVLGEITELAPPTTIDRPDVDAPVGVAPFDVLIPIDESHRNGDETRFQVVDENGIATLDLRVTMRGNQGARLTYSGIAYQPSVELVLAQCVQPDPGFLPAAGDCLARRVSRFTAGSADFEGWVRITRRFRLPDADVDCAAVRCVVVLAESASEAESAAGKLWDPTTALLTVVNFET